MLAITPVKSNRGNEGVGNIQRQEDESLVSLFLAAVDERGRVEVAVLLVVVLRGEDEGRQPALVMLACIGCKGVREKHTGMRR